MEIDKAITECDDRRLKTKYNNAIYVIQRTLALYSYGLQLDIIRSDFKSGLEALLNAKPIKAIFLGVRMGDPTAVGQEQFSPSSLGWPPFMRVNPILDWSYRDVWAFLLTCKVPYCSLYDQGYTSIGSIHDTVPNALLCINNSSGSKEVFRPAYLLSDGRLERAGRVKKLPSSVSGHNPAVINGLDNVDLHKSSLLTASAIAVGDEILFGTVEDQIGPSLCRKLHSIGWSVSQTAVVRNDIDSVAEEVERRQSTDDMVFIYGGVGPLHSDVTMAGVAKAIGVRLIKCKNVIILTATNALELDEQWNCLIELMRSDDVLLMMQSFVSKHLTTNLTDVEIARPLSKLCLEFPDLYIGCHRKSRKEPLILYFKGKDQDRIESAVEALNKKFCPGAFVEINSS